MNVLINCVISNNKFCYAIVPMELLKEYDLESINCRSNQDKDQNIGDQITILLDRLGIEPFTPYLTEEVKKNFNSEDYKHVEYKTNKDLQKYIFINPPFQVDKTIIIYSL